MKLTFARKIRTVWDEMENEFDDKSTEFLLEVTAQTVRERFNIPDFDCGDVAKALELTNNE